MPLESFWNYQGRIWRKQLGELLCKKPSLNWTRQSPLTIGALASVPDVTGVYKLFGSRGVLNFVGAASQLQSKLIETCRRGEVPANTFCYAKTNDLKTADAEVERVLSKGVPAWNA